MSEETDIQIKIVEIDNHRFGRIHKGITYRGFMRVCLNRGCLAIMKITNDGEIQYNKSECPFKGRDL